ncbi:MAG: tRNA 2-thiouridine(34) synthase MnmA [Pseudomonadota bacterium]
MIESSDIPTVDLDVPPGSPVIVAMSGGVDSSVAAALVARSGYKAIGVTLQLYDHGQAIQKKGACCAGQDIQDARSVADRLGIPHYVLDYEDRFSQSVIDDFADTYLAGATPIPCVRCNERVKFRDLMETAKDLGGAAMVTGHYVQRVQGCDGIQLCRAVDPSKDQSYFLFATTQEQLEFLRFPLGGMSKQQTRDIAASLDLPIASKPDSQDICFVPEGKYATIVEKLRPGSVEPGDIVDLDGNILGRHAGVIHYTVGQRRGLGIAVGEPLYVVKVDAPNRRVVVGPREALSVKRICLKEISWIGPGKIETAIDDQMEIAVKVRSTRPATPARLVSIDGNPGVELFASEEGVAPGQACVFYAKEPNADRVLGGGWIASAISNVDRAA